MREKFDAFLVTFRYPILLALIGLVVLFFGIFLFRSNFLDNQSSKIEVLGVDGGGDETSIVVQITGAVTLPGVYDFKEGKRVSDLFASAGGLSDEADKEWVDKNVNMATRLTDGQKIYVPKQSERPSASKNNIDQTISGDFLNSGSSLVNINTASLAELDKLPGIGPVYAQSIVEHRSYSTIEELVSKGALKASIYEKIKDLVRAF